MRMSCNGCRVLRKGCSEDCSIRPCLQWIKTAEAQANATVFLAKFYGRAGLMNLINAGPDHLRPAIFRSLLYEACGRMVNPIYGSVGLLWSGQWQLCQNAIEAVLKGAPITPIPTESAANPPPIQGAYDIRHVPKDDNSNSNSNSSAADLHRVKPTRTRFKRVGSKSTKPAPSALQMMAAAAAAAATTEWTHHDSAELNGSSTSHDSTVSHPDDPASTTDTANARLGVPKIEADADADGDDEVELELTLGFGLGSIEPKSRCKVSQRSGDQRVCDIELGLV